MADYKDAGVDIDAGERAVELMKASIAKASRKEVIGGIGGFAAEGAWGIERLAEPADGPLPGAFFPVVQPRV